MKLSQIAEENLDKLLCGNFYDTVNEALFQLIRTAFVKGYEVAYEEIENNKKNN